MASVFLRQSIVPGIIAGSFLPEAKERRNAYYGRYQYATDDRDNDG